MTTEVESRTTACARCGQRELKHPVACFGCQTCEFACDHYICEAFVPAEETKS